MDWYFAAPIWTKQHDCPNTCTYAGPKSTQAVRNKRVLSVREAKYRNAVFDGVFVLPDDAIITVGSKAKERVEVYCCWFGHRLKTRGISLTIDLNKAEVINDYTGKVVSNLARQPEKICATKSTGN